MFCPNCGTKNDDKVEKCAQCGFDQKAKKDTKFKGTVMMTGSPGAAPGTPGSGVASASRTASNPGLKGTMVGVAPPGLEAIQKLAQESAAKQASATNSNKFKGTMVGIAPPGLEELRRQHAGAGEVTAPRTSAAPQTATGNAQQPSSKLKGTMIGIAPPELSREVEAAKAKMAAQKAAAASGATRNVGEAPAPLAAADANSLLANPAKISSKMKGTMMGVAPPDMQAQIAAARAKAGPAPVGMPAVDNEPPSEPDPLGGTMVGTSPFAPGGAFGDEDAIAQARASYTPPGTDTFNEDTPAAVVTPFAPEFGSSGGPLIASDPLVAADPMSALTPAAYSAPASFDPYESPSQAAQLPISKSSTGPIIFFAVLVILVLGGVAYLAIGGGDEKTEDKASETEAEAPKEQ